MKRFSAAGSSTLAVVLLVCLLVHEAECSTFVLGGSDGWTNKANIDYNKWLSDYKVKVGDTLQFANYDTTDHSVVLVDKLGYDTCLAQGKQLNSPFTIGPNIIYSLTFGQSGQGYAICSIPGHCLQGMKVFVQILNADGSVNQNAAAADAPKANSGQAMASLSWSSQLLVVAVAIVAATTTMFA